MYVVNICALPGDCNQSFKSTMSYTFSHSRLVPCYERPITTTVQEYSAEYKLECIKTGLSIFIVVFYSNPTRKQQIHHFANMAVFSQEND